MDDLLAGRPIMNSLTVLDLLILGGAVAVLLVIAYVSGRGQSGTGDFFLGRRKVPAIVACLAFLATEISAMTIVGVPAEGYQANLRYLQFFIGSAAAKVLVAALFIPIFFKHNCTTIYEFLRHRFGAATQYAGSVFFFITRLLGAGVRLYVASLGVSVILGWDFLTTLLVFTAVSMVFIAFGGIRAVVWTGAYETIVFLVAGVAVAAYLVSAIQGGAAEAWRVADEAGKLKLLNLDVNLTDPNTLLAASIGAFFLNMSVFGTDQDFMQRMLTVESRRSSQRAMLGTIAAAVPLLCIYLGIGTLLFVYYRQNPAMAPPGNPDAVLSHFISTSAPAGIKGLVLAAIVLANIDSPLSSLSASFVTDIYRPLLVRNAGDRHYLWVGRAAVVGFAVVLAALAWACQPLTNILWVAFQILAVTGGATLGVFLLGLLTRARSNYGNVAAMIASSLITGTVLVLIHFKVLALGWTWLIVLGTADTFVLGWLLGLVLDRPAPPPPLPSATDDPRRQHAAVAR
jgi:SSS family transporter